MDIKTIGVLGVGNMGTGIVGLRTDRVQRHRRRC